MCDGIVGGFGGRDMPDGAEQAVIVEPVDPAQGLHLDGRSVRPGSSSPDGLGFVEAVDGLGECVVIRVADAADRRHQIGLGQALAVVHGKVLHASVAMMDQGAMAECG